MQIKFFISFLFISTSLFAQIKNPYLNLEFDKVVIYDLAGGKLKESVIFNQDRKLVQTTVKQVVPAKKLSDRIGSNGSYGASFARCFNPHLGFVYFLKAKIVARVSYILNIKSLQIV